MRIPLVGVLAAAVLAVGVPGVGAAAAEQAPPLLTPLAARDLAAACPGSMRYAAALVAGASREDATAAVPLLEACAAQPRLPEFRWKSDVATLGLAAAELSRGLLAGDPALLRRAADLTTDLRSRSYASDEDVRSWTVIPDSFSSYGDYYVADYLQLVTSNASLARAPVVFGPWIEDAAYVHVAATLGSAWISAPRTVAGYLYGAPASGRPLPAARPATPSVPNIRTEPARVSQ